MVDSSCESAICDDAAARRLAGWIIAVIIVSIILAVVVYVIFSSDYDLSNHISDAFC